MARFRDHEKALALRKQGMSYSQIRKLLKVSKSTLSLWLKDYPLSKQRIRELRDWSEQRIERCRETKRKKREKRLGLFYQQQRKLVSPLLNKSALYIAGLFLYWGEGSKNQLSSLSLSNTDPAVIKFFIFWLAKNLSVHKERLKVQLHLYADMSIEQEVSFWSEILDIPRSQFANPYIKKTLSTKINHKGGFGHGTCNVTIGNARLAEKVHMALKVINDRYKQVRI